MRTWKEKIFAFRKSLSCCKPFPMEVVQDTDVGTSTTSGIETTFDKMFHAQPVVYRRVHRGNRRRSLSLGACEVDAVMRSPFGNPEEEERSETDNSSTCSQCTDDGKVRSSRPTRFVLQLAQTRSKLRHLFETNKKGTKKTSGSCSSIGEVRRLDPTSKETSTLLENGTPSSPCSLGEINSGRNTRNIISETPVLRRCNSLPNIATWVKHEEITLATVKPSRPKTSSLIDQVMGSESNSSPPHNFKFVGFVPERLIAMTGLWGEPTEFGTNIRHTIPGYEYKDGALGLGYYSTSFDEMKAVSSAEMKLQELIREQAVLPVTDLKSIIDGSLTYMTIQSSSDSDSSGSDTDDDEKKKMTTAHEEVKQTSSPDLESETIENSNVSEKIDELNSNTETTSNHKSVGSLEDKPDQLSSQLSHDEHEDQSEKQENAQLNKNPPTIKKKIVKKTKKHKPPKQDTTECAIGSRLKALAKELRNLSRQVPMSKALGSMYIRFDDEEPFLLRCGLTGIAGTPYSYGVFLFDIKCPPTYPEVPPKVVHVTPGAKTVSAPNGPGGFSPNLHRDSGKVCLSLLGTWNGPGWDAGKSNLYQVLSSVMLMVLGSNNPYSMEPGYGGWEGAGDSETETDSEAEETSSSKREALVYKYQVALGNLKHGVLGHIRDPPRTLEKVVNAHLVLAQDDILDQARAWATECEQSSLNELASEFEEVRNQLLDAFTGATPFDLQLVRAAREVKYLQELRTLLHDGILDALTKVWKLDQVKDELKNLRLYIQKLGAAVESVDVQIRKGKLRVGELLECQQMLREDANNIDTWDDITLIEDSESDFSD